VSQQRNESLGDLAQQRRVCLEQVLVEVLAAGGPRAKLELSSQVGAGVDAARKLG
jgi:hypothetical protein